MDRKIKTRQVHKDIKVLDKTATVTDHVKQSYVRTKENVIQSTEISRDSDNNPVGYAEDTVSEYADRVFHGTGQRIGRHAERIFHRSEKSPVGMTTQEQARDFAVKKIKTVERDKKTIKTGKVSGQIVKNTGKVTIKTSGKSVKTAEQTAKASIKTADASIRAMHYAVIRQIKRCRFHQIKTGLSEHLTMG